MKDDELVLLFNVTNIPPYFCQHTTSFEEKKQYWQNLDECLFESDVVGFKRFIYDHRKYYNNWLEPILALSEEDCQELIEFTRYMRQEMAVSYTHLTLPTKRIV